ncbi:MAG TPA: AMP-binding protein, partial [Syntrophorhabdales bacterium]|nr:AMP-binding protein [Syntrophorhabdales bacterium]
MKMTIGDLPWMAYQEGMRLLFRVYFRLVHRIRIEGCERVPDSFNKLIVIANHATFLDGIIIWTYLRLPFKMVVDRTIAQKAWLRPFLKNRNIVPVDSMNPYSLKEIVRMVSLGTPLLVFPEGRRTSTGNIMKIYDGAGFVALKTGSAILPVYLTNTYDTLFARRHRGRRIFVPLTMTIGEVRQPMDLRLLPARERKRAATRAIYFMLCDLNVKVHAKPTTLGREFVRICKANGRRTAFSDSTGNRVTYRKALLGALALGWYLSRACPGNIAIMLPNLSATAVIFMSMQVYRRVAIFLNYSSGQSALVDAMDLADIDVVLTSRKFLERTRVPEAIFDRRKLVFIEDLRREVGWGLKARALFRFLFSGPFERMGESEEKETSCILFTSGSEGKPKGVCLSHENIVTNVYQGLSRVDVTRDDVFLNVLPMFHSFGLTVGTIIPLFAGARVFFHVSPLHFRIVPEL